MGNQALNALAVSQGYTPYNESTADNRQVGTKVLRASDVDDFLKQGLGIDDILKLGVLESGIKPADLTWLMKNHGLTPDDLNRLQFGIFSPMETPEGNAQTNALGTPDYSGFFASPDYQFRRREGLNLVQNSAAAQGGLYSGNALRGVEEYGSNLAAGEYGNWFNRQAALAGIGQTATSQAGNAALQTGANVGNLLAMQGDARASGIIGQSNALSNAINQLGMLGGLYAGGYFGRGASNGVPMANNYTGPIFRGLA